jgi:hypothetical protein
MGNPRAHRCEMSVACARLEQRKLNAELLAGFVRELLQCLSRPWPPRFRQHAREKLIVAQYASIVRIELSEW